MDRETERKWRIGELARATGLTVRALHHYDEIGLLCPAERSDAGHRLYGDSDVERLYLVVTLRELGMPLDEIAAHLHGELDARTAVASHLDRVEGQIALQHDLRDRLKRVLGALERHERPTREELLKTMEVISMHEKYYTPEQLEQLEQRRKALGDDAIKKAEQEWTELIAAVEAERARGTDPADPRVQELARRWQGLIEQFTGGDPGIFQSLKNMYDNEGVETASRGAASPDLMDYVGRIVEAGSTRS